MVEPDPPPIACSLEADALTERLERIARIGSRSLLGTDSDGRRHTLRFRDDPGARADLEAVIAAERECCPFLDLDLDDGGEDLVLTIDAGPEGEAIAAELAGAFSPPPGAAAPSGVPYGDVATKRNSGTL